MKDNKVIKKYTFHGRIVSLHAFKHRGKGRLLVGTYDQSRLYLIEFINGQFIFMHE